jgi:hypothetical protein
VRGVRALVLLGLLAGLVAGVPGTADPAGAVTLEARGSVNQVEVAGAAPGATLELRQDGGDAIRTGVADAAGTFVFGIDPGTADDVPFGSGYEVAEVGGDTVAVAAPDWGAASPPFEVLRPTDHPPQSFYDDQVLPVPANATDLVSTDADGYGYITTRDGTTLSANVLAPFNLLGGSGPYPTIVIYSGYEPSAPNVQGDPDDAVGTLLRVAGYAVVSVNIRGTGCSGGAYSYWEPLQGLDGYDVIEAVAAQPWVAQAAPNAAFDVDGGPKVGMAGISFGGISQLFVGRTNPPSLAGITPLSVIADTYRSTLYPGGIANDGFPRDWAAGREQSAQPAGQPWAAARIANGDTICAANQRYKRQAPPLVARFAQDLLFEPDPGDALAPETFVDEIEVPTFIAGAFQDEQTGGHWATLLDDFDTPEEVANGTDDLQRAVLYNGTHADALGPDVLRDILEFLDLYVGRTAPGVKAVLRAEAPPSLGDVFGADYALAPNRAATVPNQRAYEAEADVIVRWERGARDSTFCRVDANTALFQLTETPCVPDGQGDGAPFGRFETTYPSWPPPTAVADRWFLQPDGALDEAAPTVPDDQARGWSSFRYETDPGRTGVMTDPTAGANIWDKDAVYAWTPGPESDALRFVGPELTADRAYAGSGSANLWLRSTASDVDLEVTLTEVRPDGQETLIQSGWLRASNRAEAPGSTALAPRHTHLAHEPLPAGAFVRVRVELFPFAHVVRAGSRVALTVSAPGGNRPLWTFDSPGDDDATVNDIAHSVGRRSSLDLPEVTAGFSPSPTLPAGLPVCGDLRSQPCRPTPTSSRPTAVTATIDDGIAEAGLDRGIEVVWTAPEAAGTTGYEVGALPSGETFTDDDQPGLRIAVAEGDAPPAGDPAYTVTALGIGTGLPSNASPSLLPEHPFTDVSRRAWNVEAVDWVAAWHIANGFRDGTFRNAAPVTRAQFVNWLWTVFGRPAATAAHGFTDVAPDVWFGDALSWAVEQGMVTGLQGNRFAPDDQIRRGQVAQWLWVAGDRPVGYPENGYNDVTRQAWNIDALDWAQAEGVVLGFTDGTFRSGANATRGQAAAWFEATAAAVG